MGMGMMIPTGWMDGHDDMRYGYVMGTMFCTARLAAF
jgi:hypothetical protein